MKTEEDLAAWLHAELGTNTSHGTLPSAETIAAFQQWLRDGTVSLAYLRDALGDPFEGVCPQTVPDIPRLLKAPPE